MGYDYDGLYATTPNALGEPTQIFVDFFNDLSTPNQSVLDIGCGQGRDALFIARLGHSVTGIDFAPSGISDLNEAAKREGLNIKGIVADITEYTPDGPFDIILIDRTLHMLSTAPRLETLAKLITFVAPDGWLLIADESSNTPAFGDVLTDSGQNWSIHTQKRGYLFAQRLA